MTYGEVPAEAAIHNRECPNCLSPVSIGPVVVDGTRWHCKATCSSVSCEKEFIVTGRLLATEAEEVQFILADGR